MTISSRTSFILILTMTFGFLVSCQKVPLTKRKQLTLVSDQQLQELSYQQYAQLLQEAKPISNTPEAEMVKRAGAKIQQAVEKYMSDNRLSSRLEGYQWEYNLLESKDINAFCLPGGKVAVLSGILPVTQNETGLAVVMGHEIAHAVAEHGNERLSQMLLMQLGSTALSVALAEKPEQTRNLFMTAYGVGSQVGVLLPFSRTQESESDHLGLIFMAMAGYNPQEAVGFWERMNQSSQGGEPPSFISTHPSHKRRISDIQKNMPEALRYYEKR